MIFKYTAVFALGFLACLTLLFALPATNTEIPLGTGLTISSTSSPSDRLNESDITLTQSRVCLDIPNATISSYAATGSMGPFINENANGIRIVPQNESEIQIGDIISFRRYGQLIVHRVTKIATDENGIYFITRGDANLATDGKVRFDEIEYVTIGVIW